MRIIAAYLLAVLGGNANPDKDAIKKILSAAKPPIKYDEERIDLFLKEVQGKDLDELIAEGMKKIGSAVPAGGVAVAAAGGAAPAAGGDAGKKEEPKKEEEPEEEEADMGLSLFD